MAGRQPPIQLSINTSNVNRQARLSQSSKDLTPPVTPTTRSLDTSSSLTPTTPSTDRTPREFRGEINFSKDETSRPAEFGRGAWSVVYKASLLSPSSNASDAFTPPASPALTNARTVAVKTPSRRDAHAVLRREARTLTYICSIPGYERYVVPFHGYMSPSNSIVMSAIPLSLSAYIQDQAEVAREQRSTQTIRDPILGSARWQNLADKVVSALSWLHNDCHVVHGDIKPHSFLLRPRQTAASGNSTDEFPYDPLFVDFSSALDMRSPMSVDTAELSMPALTPPFTAPELLSVKALTSPDTVPTPSSDVFSLAVTLLAAATGDLLLYPGCSSMQRLAMAREGHRVLEFTRYGMSGARVPRNGIVERILEPAIRKDPAQRITPEEWLKLVVSSS